MAPLSGQMFERVAPLLATDRLVVATDRIGYGMSDPYTSPPTVPEYANATLESLDELGVERFDVYGLHSGAVESIELSTGHAERVRQVGLSGILGFPSPEEARQWVRTTVARGVAPAVAEDGEHLAWRWQRRMRWRSQSPLQDLAWAQRNLLDELLAAPHDDMTTIYAYPWIERMSQITQPLLILVTHDYLIEPTSRAVLSAPPGTRVVDVPLEEDGVAAPTGLYSATPEVMAGHLRDFFG
jgi:pimeloyl-ACP methyl ester carboxylesterase